MAVSTILKTQTTEMGPSRDWLAKDLWHASAPGAVRHAFRAGKDGDGWAAWAEYVRQRTTPTPLVNLLPGKHSPLIWALPEELERTTQTLVTELARLASGKRIDRAWLEATLPTWHTAPNNGRLTVGLALEAIAWAHALPRLVEVLDGEAWLGLLQRLVSLVHEAQTLPLIDDPLTHQLLAGELGLTLARQFSELQMCRQLLKPARAALADGLAELLDHDGELQGRYLRQTRAFLACWTRARAMGSTMPENCWNAKTETLYQRFVRQVLRLTRPDGTHVLTDLNASRGRLDKELLTAALGFGNTDENADIGSLVLGGAKRPARRRKKPLLPESAAHSEWAGLAVLRRGWDTQTPRLLVDYSGKSVQLELGLGAEVLWSGPWEVEVCQDGQRLEPVSLWSEICWYTDERVDYLELEAEFSGGLRVQRHLALAHEDAIVLMADSVLGERAANLDYRGRLPLGAGVRFEPSEEHHEGVLQGNKRRALVLPLALPEWRCDSRPGSLAATEQQLELHQSASATAIFTPLFVDLDSRRIRRPFTWRQLTVAENLEVVPPDVAVGYRVLVGDRQWLLYRSLGATGNRTLLGHNLISQLLIARFGRDGEVEALVEIE